MTLKKTLIVLALLLGLGVVTKVVVDRLNDEL